MREKAFFAHGLTSGVLSCERCPFSRTNLTSDVSRVQETRSYARVQPLSAQLAEFTVPLRHLFNFTMTLNDKYQLFATIGNEDRTEYR